VQDYVLFALIGLGFGAVYASIGMGVVVVYRGTGVINFAMGAMGAWGAYVYDELAREGDLVLPVVIVPHSVHLSDDVPFVAALVLAVLSSALIGLLAHFLVFRPLRRAPALAKVVASVGIMISIQALIVLQFTSTPRSVPPIVPNEAITLSGIDIPRDRLWLTLVVVGLAVLMWAYFRFTRLGLATRAGAENEVAVSLARYSPQMLAGTTWVLGATVVGVTVVLAAPTTVLNPITFTLAIVPALAAALVGRLTSIAVTVAAGLALGSLQSILQFQTSKSYWPDWAVTGLTDAIPFLIVVVALYFLGKALPTRGAAQAQPLPEMIRPRNRVWVIVVLVVGGVVLLAATDGTYRFGILTSMIIAVIALSLVLLTGLVGQISLAQAAFAGSAGFALSKLAEDVGVPFPLAPILAALLAAVLGVIVGIPAVRIRGAQLAVVTLAMAVALERFVFRNPNFSKVEGNLIPEPSLFGLDLSVQEGRNIARLEFALLVLAVLVLVALAIANIMRGTTGRRFLAVRSNERATAAAGVDVVATKLLAFGISAFVAGLGGTLIGYSRGQLSADSFSTLVGLSLLAFAYLGGITSISGALVAGTFAPLGIGYVILTQDPFNLSGESFALLGGIGLILTAIFNPVGIAGATRENVDALVKRLRRAPPVSDAAPAAPGPEVIERAPAPSVVGGARQAAAPAEGAKSEGEPLLETEALTVQYGGLRAVDEVSLQVGAGRIVGLIGPNGAGKTTLIDAVTGFVEHTGHVRFEGLSIDGLAPHQRGRRGLSRTWQSLEIFGELSVEENLRVASERATMVSMLLDVVHPMRRADLDHIHWALDLVGLRDHASQRPSSLSLGQQKLLGVARALAPRPRVVLLDEPAAGLDSAESHALGERFHAIIDQGISVLLVDHDMGLVLNVCDYVYVLDFGSIIAEGTPAQVRSDPVVIEAYLGAEAARAVQGEDAAPVGDIVHEAAGGQS
jgi:ABC-type branched-subunit amino acid transport system ATPase component/ABC-type branched-subunit amino acid transport system permease subunit